MVYRGKPSRGCQNCRNRKIKCDEERPICLRCRKAGYSCTGYRNEHDLIFRNETVAVVKRVQRSFSQKIKNESTTDETKGSKSPKAPIRRLKTTEAEHGSDALSEDDCEPDSEVQDDSLTQTSTDEVPSEAPSKASPREASSGIRLAPKPTGTGVHSSLSKNPWLSITLSPTYPTEAAATVFFFQNHAMRPRHAQGMRGHLEYLVDMYMDSSPNTLLRKATHAVALAALSNYYRTSALRLRANEQYVKALQEIRLALQDPVAARSDELLMSILLFSLFEYITSTSPSRIVWTQHISGAVSLVKLRGEPQLENTRSLFLFRAVRGVMLISSIAQGKPLTDFPAAKGWRCDEDFELNPSDHLNLIRLSLPNLRYCAEKLLLPDGIFSRAQVLMKLIRTAKEIDSELEHWALTVPKGWMYSADEFCTEEPVDLLNAECWPGPIHIYSDSSIAGVWNNYRISRMICQTVILCCANSLPPHISGDELIDVSGQARQILQDMINEISWSIPFLLTYNFETRSELGQNKTTAKGTGSYFAIWPLYMAKECLCVPERQKRWLEGRLSHIGKTYCIT